MSEYERWLIEEIVPAYDAIKKDPSLGLSIDQVRASLAALHAKASSSRPTSRILKKHEPRNQQ
jgi:hypothetical protein